MRVYQLSVWIRPLRERDVARRASYVDLNGMFAVLLWSRFTMCRKAQARIEYHTTIGAWCRRRPPSACIRRVEKPHPLLQFQPESAAQQRGAPWTCDSRVCSACSWHVDSPRRSGQPRSEIPELLYTGKFATDPATLHCLPAYLCAVPTCWTAGTSPSTVRHAMQVRRRNAALVP
jgi:hypothetical protein